MEEPTAAKIEKVVLAGFMGAGKSTVGPVLAARLGWRFIDTDHSLEQHLGLTVAQIFEQHGEESFRRLEAENIRHLIAGCALVLALGGGALEEPSTRLMLRSSPGVCLVFLDAPAETLIARCEEQERSRASGLNHAAAIRPLFEELSGNRASLEQKLAARLPNYQIAHLTVGTAGRSPSEVTHRILAELALGHAQYHEPYQQKATAEEQAE